MKETKEKGEMMEEKNMIGDKEMKEEEEEQHEEGKEKEDTEKTKSHISQNMNLSTRKHPKMMQVTHHLYLQPPSLVNSKEKK